MKNINYPFHPTCQCTEVVMGQPSCPVTSVKISPHRKRPAEVEASTESKSCTVKSLPQPSFRVATSIALVPAEDKALTLCLHSATGRVQRNRQGEARLEQWEGSRQGRSVKSTTGKSVTFSRGGGQNEIASGS